MIDIIKRSFSKNILFYSIFLWQVAFKASFSTKVMSYVGSKNVWCPTAERSLLVQTIFRWKLRWHGLRFVRHVHHSRSLRSHGHGFLRHELEGSVKSKRKQWSLNSFGPFVCTQNLIIFYLKNLGISWIFKMESNIPNLSIICL